MRRISLHRWLLCFSTFSVLVAISAVAVTAAPVNDSHGKEWRQLVDTTGLSWNQIAQVCPQNGFAPCFGSIGGRNLTGWVWATDAQVVALLSYFEPAILTAPSISGQQYFSSASSFLSAFQPTQRVTTTYSNSEWAGGWTSSKNASSLPIAAGVGAGTTSVSIDGSFSIGPVSNPAEASAAR